MNDSQDASTPPSAPRIPDQAPAPAATLRNLGLAIVALIAVFSVPLYGLVRFALQSQLFSHVILVPFISLFLIWLKRHELPPLARPDRRWSWLPFGLAGALLVLRLTTSPGLEDALALTTLTFVLMLAGLCMLFLGPRTLRAIAFPLVFLVFMAPFPTALTAWIETVLQNWSAEASYWYFKLGGTTVFRQGTYFELPGMKLQVAAECSGIHSTLGLFITSLLAGHFFLRSVWARTVLTLVVFPLAILRNGLRVFVIGELCVRYGPEMIDSYIHRQGGPIFFTISLIPFFLILWLLVKAERRRPQPKPTSP